jgi:hypothetical protein
VALGPNGFIILLYVAYWVPYDGTCSGDAFCIGELKDNLFEWLDPTEAANNCQAPFLCNTGTGPQNTIGPPQQWHPAKQSSWLNKYVTQVSCESSVIIAKASDQFEVLFGGTLGVTLGVARSSPFVTGGGALLLSAAVLGDSVTARSTCVPIAWGN